MNNTVRLYNFKDHLFVSPLLLYSRSVTASFTATSSKYIMSRYLASYALFSNKSFYSTENLKSILLF